MKKLIEPKLHSAQDIYLYYVKKLLKENPTYYTGRDKINISNSKYNIIVYKPLDKGRVEEIITYKRFKNILSEINKSVINRLIVGDIISLGNGLGYLGIRKIQRNFKKKAIDGHSTNKRKVELMEQGVTDFYSKDNPDGVKYMIYFTDDYYYRIGWIKNNSRCKVTNMTQYKFSPSTGRGESGFKNKFKKAIKENPLLGFKYQEFKYKSYGSNKVN